VKKRGRKGGNKTGKEERLGGKAETLVNGKKRVHEERKGVSMTARTIMTAEVQGCKGYKGDGEMEKR
jgi:hypothetical protein